MMQNNNMNYAAVCYGEILWDILPAGGKLPGGAPINVAYHLSCLQNKTAVISRIGDDLLGKELFSVFAEKGLDTSFVQTGTMQPTGTVYAKFDEQHDVTYDIVQNVAWDEIQYTPALAELVRKTPYFIFGSLASRCAHKASRNTLLQLLPLAQTRVLDINLRPPHYTRVFIEQLLPHTGILKMNHHELDLVAGWYGDYHDEQDQIKFLSNKYNIPTIVVTKGADGAVLYTANKFYTHKGYSVNVADTIGSGDAFLAGLLNKFIESDSPDEALAFACATGALIASYKGPCPEYNINEIMELMNGNNNDRLINILRC